MPSTLATQNQAPQLLSLSCCQLQSSLLVSVSSTGEPKGFRRARSSALEPCTSLLLSSSLALQACQTPSGQTSACSSPSSGARRCGPPAAVLLG